MYDPEFKGPKKERSSTDVAFTIIFSIVVVLWLAMGFWGETKSTLFYLCRNIAQ